MSRYRASRYRAGPATAAILGMLAAGPAAAAVFEQGPVEPRAWRNETMAAAAAHPVETENLFGFTLGSDIDPAGTWGVAFETIGAFGKREGRYAAGNSKLELSYAPIDNLSVSFSLLGGAWDINGNPDLPDTKIMRFRGAGGELRWRLLERGPSPVGLTLHVEPSMTLADEVTGQAGTGYGSENKLILDAMLVSDRLWGGLNLLYDLETFRPWSGPATEEGSVGGVSGGLTARVTPTLFLGAEIRYLMAFEKLLLSRQVGNALYLGPTGYWRMSNTAWMSLAWNIQVAGHANNDPARLDLTNFSRQMVRFKLGFEF